MPSILSLEKLEFFKENGYVVLDNIVEEEKCDEAFNDCWTFVETVSAGKVKREDPSTHTTRNDWPGGVHGLIQNYGVGQSKVQWDMRMHPKIQPLFTELYVGMGMDPEAAQDLVATFDGLSFPRTNSQKYLDNKWLHKDQKLKDWEYNWNTQCGINVGDSQDMDDHVFSCIPKSHKFHKEYSLANAKFAKEQEKKGHFAKLTESQISWHTDRGMVRIRVPIAKGSVVLWDSRLVHASSSSRKKHPKQRAQLFVSFIPRCKQSTKALKKRKEHFEKGRTTGHSGRLFPKRPRTYGRITGHVDVPPFYTKDNAPVAVMKLM